MMNRRKLLGMGGALGVGAVLAPVLSAASATPAAADDPVPPAPRATLANPPTGVVTPRGPVHPPVTRSRGGSNYGWYRLDGCDRVPYGVVNRFDVGADRIRAQLAQMRAAGQE